MKDVLYDDDIDDDDDDEYPSVNIFDADLCLLEDEIVNIILTLLKNRYIFHSRLFFFLRICNLRKQCLNPEQNSLAAEEIAALKKVARPGLSYFVRPSADPCFFPG